jgi:DNA repair exonuclease SbcCD ATPase subunit
MITTFERFTVRNGMCVEHAELPLEDQGLVLIRGENLDEGDSNGSGKTTLFELLAHTLFGSTTKGARRNALLNLKDPTSFHTQVKFRRDEVSYQVDQYRKHPDNGTGIEVYKNGSTDNSALDGYDNAQKEIAKLIGLTWREFQGSVYLSQKYTHTMIEGLPSEKQKYLSRYFGLDRLDAIVTESTRRLSAIPLPDYTQLQGMLDHVLGELDVLGAVEEFTDVLRDGKKQQSKTQKKMLGLQVQLKRQEEARLVEEDRKNWLRVLKKLRLDLDPGSIEESLQDYRARGRDIESLKKALHTQEKLEAQLLDLGVDVEQSYEDIADDVERLESVVRKLERLLPKAERREELLEDLEPVKDAQGNPETLKAKRGTRKDNHRSLRGEMAVLISEISNLKEIRDNCPTCSRPLDESERRRMIREREKAYSDISDRCDKARASVEKLSDRIEAVETRLRLEEQIAGLPDQGVEDLRARLDNKTREKRRLSSLAAKLVKASSIQDRLYELELPEEDVAQLDVRLGKVDARISSLEGAYKWVLANGDVEYDSEEHQRTQESLLYYEEKLEELNALLLEAQDKSTRYETLSEQKKDLESSLSHSTSYKSRHQALSYVTVTLKELKKMGLRESTELLTQVLPVYLGQLFPDGEIGLRVTDKADGFDLLFEKGGQSIPLSLISGGQAKRVGIAIIFAFAKMGKRTTNLLIADEPFTHLDCKGRSACYELLRDLNMGTVLVTAHDQDLQATRKYDQIWTVRMENHRSRLYLDG